MDNIKLGKPMSLFVSNYVHDQPNFANKNETSRANNNNISLSCTQNTIKKICNQICNELTQDIFDIDQKKINFYRENINDIQINSDLIADKILEI